MVENTLTWVLLAGYCGFLLYLVRQTTPDRVSPPEFFEGQSSTGQAPGLWLLVASAAISWIFAKSIDNAASLGQTFGVLGGIGYAIYYLSFVTAAIALYFLRTRGGYRSIPEFLVSKYGKVCSRLFLLAIAIRLLNEVWSNTKVFSLYFGPEGSAGYWLAALVVTLFTVYYTLLGGLRSSLLTDGAQMVLAAVLLVVILATVGPGLAREGLPVVDADTSSAALTFCGLAFVQVFSYPFHDPVMTDRAFITGPRTMFKGFIWAGAISGGFIFLFSSVGLYARAIGAEGSPSLVVPALFGLPMLLVFNAIMLTSAGSTLDSTFSSTAKVGARDWFHRKGAPTEGQARIGRWWIIAIALLGNVPLLSIYMGDRVGPAIILATTISGTMVMGLAPIFLLAFLPRAGALSFHLAFWPGILLGVLRVAENVIGAPIFPAWVSLGSGKYAVDLGVNIYGLLLCTTGYLLGAWLGTLGTKPSKTLPGA
ncbi:Na+/proline symporter [Nodosilinea sp. LEGE 07298]|uniref:Na+/proline symporter n=1 Tax=Nodosilinea sp. LEGE 07298 TaxID=2777970 RepID=UPI0018804065|nr:Na+/proline symporter [Nodosilinea sp. LEGE 07298]MBE9109546.1 Na+/proline symporter [Nodosilinea sp. LEGE 07298]